jgi:hypothetical protein
MLILYTQKPAGTKLLEIHGNIYKARCTECETVFDNLSTSLPKELIRCLPVTPWRVRILSGLANSTICA